MSASVLTTRPFVSRSMAHFSWLGISAILLAALTFSPSAKAQASLYACFGAGTSTTNPETACPAASISSVSSPLYSVSIGGSNPAAILSGVLRQGKSTLSEVSLLKSTDPSSDALTRDAYLGTILPSVVIGIYSTATTPAYVITLTNAVVSSWSVGGSGAETQLFESISLSYEKLSLLNTVTHQTVTWNLQTNAPTAQPVLPPRQPLHR